MSRIIRSNGFPSVAVDGANDRAAVVQDPHRATSRAAPMILLIGATGRIGSEVVSQLAAADERPRILVRDSAAARQRFGERVHLIDGDLDQPETIEAALAGVDRVFLVTTQSIHQPSWERAVIRAAARSGVDHLVKLSVFRADEHSPLQIARQHWQTEQELVESGLAATILRPVFFMQNLLAMVRGDAIATAAGDGRVAMIDVRDIAAVAVAALTRPGHAGKTYTLTGPEALSFDDVARILSHQAGRQISPHAEVCGCGLHRTPGERCPGLVRQRHGSASSSMLADGYEDVVTDDVHTVTGRWPHTLIEVAPHLADAMSR